MGPLANSDDTDEMPQNDCSVFCILAEMLGFYQRHLQWKCNFFR